jgi:hypothetical protein
MPTCISLNSTVDFTVTTLSAPQDGYTIAIAQATPSPTATPVPTPTPSPSPSPSPSASPLPSATPVPTPTSTPVPTATTVPPTPSPTSVALCINVGGSTNNFTATQLAGPDNGFSFFNNVIVNPTPTATAVPPTPSPTPATGTPISGGATCDVATNWPAYGSANKYQITLVANVEQCFNVTSPASRSIYMSAQGNPAVAISGTVALGQDSGGFSPLCFYDSYDSQLASNWLSGVGLDVTNVGTFSLVPDTGVNGTFDIWII